MSRPRKIRSREQRLADTDPNGSRAQRRAARKSGLEPAPKRRHTPSTATEPDSNRAHTE